MILPLGSIVNALSVIVGSIIGIYFGSFLSEKIRKNVFQIIGLFTLALGIQMSLKTNQFLILLVSLIIGTIIGESCLSIEKGVESLSNKLKIKLQSENKLFSEGLITAFLLYCVGSMTFVGSIEEGIHQDRTLMFTKSLMDGITSILLASSFWFTLKFGVANIVFFILIKKILCYILSTYYSH